MDFLQRNLFTRLRAEIFHTAEEMEPMTTYKHGKIEQMIRNIESVPAGEVALSNGFLNRRLIKIQTEERHAIDTSVETLYLLRIIVSNITGTLTMGIPLRGITQLGLYLRTRGDKVDFVKLDKWLDRLHIHRMAQLQGSILIEFFDFDADEIPFVHHLESSAYKSTLRSLNYNAQDYDEQMHFRQNATGFVSTNSRNLRRNLRRSIRYFDLTPIETTSNFVYKFFKSLSEIEE